MTPYIVTETAENSRTYRIWTVYLSLSPDLASDHLFRSIAHFYRDQQFNNLKNVTTLVREPAAMIKQRYRHRISSARRKMAALQWAH